MLRDTLSIFRESLRDAWQVWRIFFAIVAFFGGMYIAHFAERFNLTGLVIAFVALVAIRFIHISHVGRK